jgi:hypothetical protein
MQYHLWIYLKKFFALAIVTLMLLTGKNTAIAASKRTGEMPTLAKFAYFFGDFGTFLKVDTQKMSTVSKWYLSRIDGLAPILPPYFPSPQAYWLPGELKYDPNNGRLYGVFPKKDLPEDEGQLVIMQLPLMEAVGRVDFAHVTERPRILLTADGNKLFISYGERPPGENYYIDVIDVYDTRSLKKLKTYSVKAEKKYAQTGEEPSLFFFEKAYIAPDEHAIYDKSWLYIKKISLVDNKAIQEKIDPIQLLPESQKTLLRQFEHVYPATKKKILSYSIADFKAGKALIQIFDASGKQKIMFSIDIETKQMTPNIDIPSPAIIHLTPDGKQAILEGVERETERKNVGGVEADVVKKGNKTGKFWVYDLVTGKLTTEFSKKEELAGNEKTHVILCIAPDNSLMFYSDNINLYAVSLKEDIAPIIINTDYAVYTKTKCVFADR